MNLYNTCDLPYESDGYLISNFGDITSALSPLNHAASPHCRISPLVILSILDSHVRRQPGHQLVLGTLLGYVNESGNILISDCFVDKHSFTDDGMLSIMIDTHETMFELKQKVNSKLQVVGWYSTGTSITPVSCAVHNWFRADTFSSKFQSTPLLLDPIHILVDSSFSNGKISVSAYTQIPLSWSSSSISAFQSVPLDIMASTCERLHISHIIKPLLDKHHYNALGLPPKILPRTILGPEDELCTVLPLNSLATNPYANLNTLISKLLLMVQKCLVYVQKVQKGEIVANSIIGRQIDQAIHMIYDFDPHAFNVAKQVGIQDSLIIGCLTELTKVQLALAEKLQTLMLS
ncbi:MOV34 MPN PAD-1 family protein [Cryptosporidium andersoni]|uniref:MOV34 MPN PAD-1 family protein n=1 Tax=Cryptosporidium andersoni TaxID=117008 RepID=A0A1J4MP56_9CRYT|nr:MOV34 MPN PAD-1 family protein [Cryptosporidium andersoni]